MLPNGQQFPPPRRMLCPRSPQCTGAPRRSGEGGLQSRWTIQDSQQLSAQPPLPSPQLHSLLRALGMLALAGNLELQPCRQVCLKIPQALHRSQPGMVSPETPLANPSWIVSGGPKQDLPFNELLQQHCKLLQTVESRTTS